VRTRTCPVAAWASSRRLQSGAMPDSAHNAKTGAGLDTARACGDRPGQPLWGAVGAGHPVRHAEPGQRLRRDDVARRAGVPHDAPLETTGLDLLAVLGLADPPRPDVADAVAACRRAHIRLAVRDRRPPRYRPAPSSPNRSAFSARTASSSPAPNCPDDDRALADLLERDGVVIARVTPNRSCASPAACRRAATSWP